MPRTARTPRSNTLTLVGTVATLALVSACGAEEPASTAQPMTTQDVAALFDTWNAALATGDPAVVAARYAPDAVLLPTVSDEVRDTPELIEKYFTEFLAQSPVGTIDQSTVRVLDDGVATDVGVYTFALTGDDGATQQVQARYSFVYELVDGEWLIAHHHSSAMPEA